LTDAVLENPSAAEAQEGGLLSLLATYRRHLWLMLLIAAVVFAAVTAITFLMTPKYTAIATVVFSPQHVQVGTETAVQQDDPTGSFGIDTRVEQLKSRELTEAVVRRLNLDKDPEFFKTLTGADAKGPNVAQKQLDAVVDQVGRFSRRAGSARRACWICASPPRILTRRR